MSDIQQDTTQSILGDRVRSLSLDRSSRCVKIKWWDDSSADYPFVWLRDNDPAGFHPDTRERQFNITSIDLDDEVCDAKVNENELTVSWKEESHVAVFCLDWLHENQPGEPRFDSVANKQVLWRSGAGSFSIARFVSDKILNHDAQLLTWLEETKRSGVTIVEGLNHELESDIELAKRVGKLRQTNFGMSFDVKSKPNPNNLAYTALALPMHTDLPNFELPPGYQFLSCILNDAKGGGSLFSDGFAVAEDLRNTDPTTFDLLANTLIPFRFHDGDTDIRYRHPVINLNEKGEVIGICFNAHLTDALDLAPEKIEAYYRAYQRFMSMVGDNAYVVSLKLRAGEMVVFDNRRILHGRESFDPGSGDRHLRGFYIDRSEFESRIRILNRDLEIG